MHEPAHPLVVVLLLPPVLQRDHPSSSSWHLHSEQSCVDIACIVYACAWHDAGSPPRLAASSPVLSPGGGQPRPPARRPGARGIFAFKGSILPANGALDCCQLERGASLRDHCRRAWRPTKALLVVYWSCGGPVRFCCRVQARRRGEAFTHRGLEPQRRPCRRRVKNRRRGLLAGRRLHSGSGVPAIALLRWHWRSKPRSKRFSRVCRPRRTQASTGGRSHWT